MWSDQRLWHGKHPEHHQGLWIPALPHAGQPGAPLPAPPPARHTARWEGEEECPERAVWEGQQGGLQPQQDLPVDTAAGAAPAGQGGEHAETGCWWYTQRGGCSPWVSSISRSCWHFPASPACGKLGVDRMDTALEQREGSRGFGSLGIFSPAALVLPPGPAGLGPGKPLTDEGCGREGLSECL